jgi:hypothetical protein
MIDVRTLGRLVQEAVEKDPPPRLAEYCGDQYRPYYHLLYLLARHTPHKCVELGVEKGRGSLAMLLAGREVWAFDHTKRAEIDGLLREFHPRFRFREEPSLPPSSEVDAPVGVLHVDTEHSFSMAREEFWAWKPLLVPGSVVCFDDTHAQDSEVGHFVATLPWPTVFDDRLHECGYAVMVYDGERP